MHMKTCTYENTRNRTYTHTNVIAVANFAVADFFLRPILLWCIYLIILRYRNKFAEVAFTVADSLTHVRWSRPFGTFTDNFL